MSDKFSLDDVAAAVRGAAFITETLRKVFSEASAEEIHEHAKAISETPTAQALLHQVLVLRKLPLG